MRRSSHVLVLVSALVSMIIAACHGTTDVSVGSYTVTAPGNWNARRDDSDPGHLTLILAPDPATILCRLEVIEGAGGLGVEQADVFLTLARRDFPGGQERPVELRTKTGVLHGFALRNAIKTQPRPERSDVEVYAGVVGGDLVAAVAGGWSDQAERKACLDTIKSLRRRVRS